jgi:hypothetical protein
MGGKTIGAGVLAACLVAAGDAGAVVSLRHDLEVGGFAESKTAIRTPKFQDAELVMQRNTVQLEGRWEFLRKSSLFGLSTGVLEEGTLSAIGRTAYDSVYDVRESYRDRFSDDERDDLRLESQLRELYSTLLLPPLELRLGRQQVVWGETDFFRALDVINPLDYRWHFYYEPFEDIRVPLWMARGVYDIGTFGALEEVFFEGLWIPGDFESTKLTTDPRRPWGFFGQGVRERADSAVVDGTIFDLRTSVRDDKPDRSLENSEVGFRMKGLFGLLDFSLNYFWTISDDPGVKVRAGEAGILAAERADAAGTLDVPVVLEYPRSHVVGVAANYAEEAVTQAVWRVESTYTTGVPVALGPEVSPELDRDGNLYDTAERVVLMLGFDRPTWIESLNRASTFFLSGQIFWRRYLDYNRHFAGFSSVYPLDGTDDRFVSVNTDRITEDELAATFLATTNYGPGGIWRPTLLAAWDVVGMSGYTHLEIEHIFSHHVILRLRQAVFWGRTHEGPWFVGGRFGRPGDSRHETVASVVFQF